MLFRSGPGVRHDSGAEAGGDVPIYYDPLISKLSVWGADRPQAIARMRRALREYEVRGIRTTLPFFTWMLEQPAFSTAEFHTGTLDELLQQRQGAPFGEAVPSLGEVAAIAAVLIQLRAGQAGTTRHQAAPLADASLWKSIARREALRG